MGNLVLLLTAHVFQRPWCLVEIWSAVRAEVPIVPVLVTKQGMDPFQFPTEGFYQELAQGAWFSDEDRAFFASREIDFVTLSDMVKSVFNSIAVPFKPHTSYQLR